MKATRRSFLASLLSAPLARWLLPERARTWLIVRYDPAERRCTYTEFTDELKRVYPIGTFPDMVERESPLYRELKRRR